MKKNRFSFSESSRRDLLRAGMYGVCVSAAALPMPLFGQAAAALAGQGQIERKDPGGAGTLGRQRRPQHAGSLRRRRLLQAPAESRHPAQGTSAPSTITSDSAAAWPASSACIRTASWPSCMAADTRIRRSRISRRWRTGTRPRPTAASNTAGWAVWPMRWRPTRRRISW